MEEMQSIVKRIENNHDDLEAWQRRGELVDDPQKQNDCRGQVARINKERTGQVTPAAATANPNASRLNTSVTANLSGGQLPMSA